MEGLRKFLEEAYNTLQSIKERFFQLMDDAMATSVHHFEKASRRIGLLYPHLNLSPLDLFKVVLGGDLVNEE